MKNILFALSTICLCIGFVSCNKDIKPIQDEKEIFQPNSIRLDDSLYFGSTEYAANFIKFSYGDNYLLLASNAKKLKTGIYRTTKALLNSSGTFSTDDIAADELIVQLKHNNIIYVYLLDTHEEVNATLKSQVLMLTLPKMMLTPAVYPSDLKPESIELSGLLNVTQYK
ncbi:MAG: hypothetical protein M9958_08360 [Chitinophagales bacterium]|nr:hypothetical protein [Chitinophagales bacterium]